MDVGAFHQKIQLGRDSVSFMLLFGCLLLATLMPANQVDAQEVGQDIDIATPEIEAVRASLKLRAQNLYPFLDAGQVGIGRDGMLKIRSVENLVLQRRAVLHRLVMEDNQDRLALYREIARANGFPEKVAEVQAIFAESWRDRAVSGWYLEGEDGTWKQK